jgi:hypothetical protein
VHYPTAFWVVLGLLVFAFVVFMPALKQLPLDEFLPNIHITRKPATAKTEERVWVNKRSGFYYCPNAHGYGTLVPGEFMTRGEAVQKGFRPAPNVPCK